MRYAVSLSKIFKEQLAQIVEFDTLINSKKVIQNTKQTANELETMQRSGMSMQTTRIRSPVAGTKYIVVYRVVNNPKNKLIARRIIRCR
ncbi:MAG: hypothetical protein IIC67_01765 [Thaumarchaeota archaeon]|nr:hypothetical protein [Nitrososphaerota archaeon]